ncbi:MAG: hypothetical protein VYA67_21795 [Actinomycetota bacterium]|nr:hypothetical protein [Actinomycetota bacterium]
MFGAIRFVWGLVVDAVEALTHAPLGSTQAVDELYDSARDPQRDSRWPHGRDWDEIPDAEYAREIHSDDDPDASVADCSRSEGPGAGSASVGQPNTAAAAAAAQVPSGFELRAHSPEGQSARTRVAITTATS